MAKAKTIYACNECGHQSPKWLGRCPSCGAWNSFLEEMFDDPGKHNAAHAHRAIAPESAKAMSIQSLDTTSEPRLLTNIKEFDRTLGGGFVAGSVILLGGDPGVGKSTLVLQALDRLAVSGHTALYVTGEESPRQVKLRAERLGVDAEKLFVAALTDVGKIEKEIKAITPAIVAVDSIQTVYTAELSGAPGSVSQVRESAARLLMTAKRLSIPFLLVGHVTKGGVIAGPKVLEHMVDCVLSFEGDRSYAFRVLRAMKNRFGSTNEIGVFEMKSSGLTEVDNPSQVFLAERPTEEAGSVVTVSMEGTRPLLVEIQALVSPTSFGNPRRTTIGVDANRVALLAAVLEKKAGIDLAGCDIFVNVAGGVRLNEPAVDMGIAIALVSSLVERPIDSETVVFGELGLAGEVRSVTQPDMRIAEAAKMGFRQALTPKNTPKKKQKTFTIKSVATIAEAIELLF